MHWEGIAQSIQFEDGATMRVKGVFAPDILLITEGAVDCILSEQDDIRLQVRPGDVVGEFGFLTGKGANATLRANGPVSALSIDAPALSRLQRDAPVHAARVLRHLALLMQDRVGENADLLVGAQAERNGAFEVIRCSTLDQLRTARQIRYDVICLEYGRSSPFADDDEGTIVDEYDQTGTSFLLLREGLPVGTARANVGRQSELASMAELYGVEESGFDFAEAAILTKLAIRDGYRDSDACLRIFSAIVGFVHTIGAKSLFLDCDAKLARFFATLGFSRTAPDFAHCENGISIPMVLDLEKYFTQLPLEERVRRNHWG